MPAYNAQKYIGEAVQSVINQTYPHWELIIVNDGSTDDTLRIAQSFTDNRIRVSSQENKGQCAAANSAFAKSAGRLIKFFDADDILSPGFLAQQVARLQGRADCVASAKWGRFYGNDLSTFTLNPESVWQDMPADEWLIQSWREARPMMQCGLWLIPREIILKAGLWDERLSLINDFEYFTRLLLHSKQVLFSSEATLYYRSGIEGNLSGTKTTKGMESAYLSTEMATTALLRKRDDEAARLSCANIWQNFIYDAYPACPHLVKKAQARLAGLPAPTLRFHCGGYSKLLLPLTGWKLLKKLQVAKQHLFKTSKQV